MFQAETSAHNGGKSEEWSADKRINTPVIARKGRNGREIKSKSDPDRDTEMTATREKQFENYETMMNVFGELDNNIKRLSDAFGVSMLAVGTCLSIKGEEAAVEDAMNALEAIEQLSAEHPISSAQVDSVIERVRAGEVVNVNNLLGTVAITARGRIVRAKTFGQRTYVDAIKSNPIVFGVGPAGTGKTYLAVALAVQALKSGEVDRIILTRPAVEAGEKLGFLPGDLNEKVDPYLRPLFDALREFMGEDAYQRSIERGSIEIAPLAYMRGRTLGDSFIILDEAQNTTPEQMEMFLTRMGENSRVVVTGDLTQIDLPKTQLCGMKHAISALKDVKGIKIVHLTSKDVVRNEFVARIVEAYEKYESNRRDKADPNGENEDINAE